MRKLHLDVETYSSVDIRTSGAYKYTQSVDFEILMLAYAFDDEPTKMVDLAAGEEFPEEFLEGFRDPKVLKIAHNANFERNCFAAIGIHVPIEEWFCTAVKSAYCGLPLSLEGVSEALNLGEKGKLATGKALIRYFCVPIKGTETNGFRVRNLWFHDLEKWNEFKNYCINDVEAEREIERLLEGFVLPETEKQMYILDQIINDRGILVDVQMAENVCEIDKKNSEALLKELTELTGLDKPNSPARLKEWLRETTKEDIQSVAKAEIDALIKTTGSDLVKRVLKLRKRAAKTSIKKYTAALNCAGWDDRIRGLFQFYGANRTGRWAGRLVQLQNLRRNNLSDIDLARDLCKNGNFENLKLFFDDIADVLSQLIRTVFVPSPGKTFGVADFSAIEARVIAWLANETWRLVVFRTHGKIYEASAAMMFNVDISEVTKGSEYRDKGKIAELALGYQGALGALKTMGGEQMGLTDSEMTAIVTLWRKRSPNIVKLWAAVNNAAIHTIETKKTTTLSQFKNLVFRYENKSLTIELPSGRKLVYHNATLSQNRFGHKSIKYKGVEQNTKKWWWVETYGGKLVENIVQAIARDILAVSMIKLHNAGFDIVMHVHDEVVAELDDKMAESKLQQMCEIMGEEVNWAEGLPLGADGYTTKFYKKD